MPPFGRAPDLDLTPVQPAFPRPSEARLRAPAPSSVFPPEGDGHAVVGGIALPTDGTGKFAAIEEPAGGSVARTATPRFVLTLSS